MIHLFAKHPNPENTRFSDELRRSGMDFRIFGEEINLKFKNRWELLLLGYPRLLRHALKYATISLGRSRPVPDVAVLESDVEALVFWLVRGVTRRRTKLVWQTFIYTERPPGRLAALRDRYIGFILDRVDRVICHSRLEVERYRERFPSAADKFVFVPWTGQLYGWEEVPLLRQERLNRPLKVLSAGRSGRDYPLLDEATRGLEGVDVTIVCDHRESLGGVQDRPGLRVLRQCYGADFMREMRECDVMVLPLKVVDISAGQMVLIQGQSYGKPVVITRTPTVEDYTSEGDGVVLVAPGSADELRAAILQLRDDDALRARLSAAARQTYIDRFSSKASVRYLGDMTAELRAA